MICSKCGTDNANDDLFCVECGSKLGSNFCSSCGAEILSGNLFCVRCGNRISSVNTPSMKTNDVVSDLKVAQLSENKPVVATVDNVANKPEYSYYKRYNEFIVTDKSIIHKGIEYYYSSLYNLVVLWDASNFVHGCFQIYGIGLPRPVDILFNEVESKYIHDCFEYVNFQIDIAHGRYKCFRYSFHVGLNSKIEVYDDFVLLYTLDKGFMRSIKNCASGGMIERLVKFSDLFVRTNESNCLISFYIDARWIDFGVTKQNFCKALEAEQYINRVKSSPVVERINISAINEKWLPIKGEPRVLYLNDKELLVSAELDQFNSYMLKFRHLASLCANELIKESSRKVFDLYTYITFFPFIYDKYLDVMLSKAVDILVAEGIWNITYDELKTLHYEENGTLLVDDMSTTINSILNTIENNQSYALTSLLGTIPQCYSRLCSINAMQQNELFGRVDFNLIYHHVFRDYALVFVTMVNAMKRSGKNVWVPSPESINDAKNIFQNITHPNFPEGKKEEVLLKILSCDPYQIEYYQYMINKWGENAQTIAIKNYFGFFDFNNPRMCITR